MPILKGGAPTYYLPKFSRKLYENEEILAEGGRPWRPPLDPPLFSDPSSLTHGTLPQYCEVSDWKVPNFLLATDMLTKLGNKRPTHEVWRCTSGFGYMMMTFLFTHLFFPA